jgi:hypothetical protein
MADPPPLPEGARGRRDVDDPSHDLPAPHGLGAGSRARCRGGPRRGEREHHAGGVPPNPRPERGVAGGRRPSARPRGAPDCPREPACRERRRGVHRRSGAGRHSWRRPPERLERGRARGCRSVGARDLHPRRLRGAALLVQLQRAEQRHHPPPRLRQPPQQLHHRQRRARRPVGLRGTSWAGLTLQVGNTPSTYYLAEPSCGGASGTNASGVPSSGSTCSRPTPATASESARAWR